MYIALSLLNSGSLAALRDRCNTPCLQHYERVYYACARAERALPESVLPDVDAALMGVAVQHVLPMHQTMLCVQPDTVGVHVNELLLYNDYLQNMLADFSAKVQQLCVRPCMRTCGYHDSRMCRRGPCCLSTLPTTRTTWLSCQRRSAGGCCCTAGAVLCSSGSALV